MSKIILFPNTKSRDYYLTNNYGNIYTLDITQYKTLYEFYKILLNKYFKIYSLKFSITEIEESIAIINIHQAILKFIKQNKKSIISKQQITYELANSIYNFIEEITFAKFIANETINFENQEHLEDIKKIISIYKNHNKENKLYDEYDKFEVLINAINEKKVIELEQVQEIEIYNFESIPFLYVILLKAIEKNYNTKITIFTPYNMDNIFNIEYKHFYQNIGTIKSNNITNFAESLIKKENLEKYKDNIKLISGFGVEQEVYTVIDEVVKLIDNNIAPNEIAIIFSDTTKYTDIITNRLNECNIPFNIRRGNFIWRQPIIPILTSIFYILNIYDNEIKIDINNLIKVLSSEYFKNLENIKHYTIREELFSNKKIFNNMPLNDFLFILENDINHLYNTINNFISIIKELMYLKTYKSISDKYIEVLKFLKVDSIFDEESNIYKEKDEKYYKDNNTIAIFIEMILKLSILETTNENTITALDFIETLNLLIKDEYIKDINNEYLSINISNIYDARGIKANYIFILGMNNDFINVSPNTFFISHKLREKINSKYNKYVLNTQNFLSEITYALFLNILSSCKDNTNIYFSFRMKDENGNLEIPFFYLEDLFLHFGINSFDFETLKENNLIYKKDYIANGNSILTKKENLMGLIFHKDKFEYSNYINFDKDDINIIKSIYDKNKSNNYANPDSFIHILKEELKKPISVTHLQSIMECPVKYIYTKLFKRDEIPYSTSIIGINNMQKGLIYHSLFENFYKEVGKQTKSFSLNEKDFNTYNNIAKEVIEEVLLSHNDILFSEYDINTLKEEAYSTMNAFINYETSLMNETEYIPNSFEERIKEYKIYSKNGINIIINGIIDRIDLYKNSNNIVKGIRVLDYKGSEYSVKTISKADEENKNIIKQFIQPLIYLKYAIEKYIIKNDKEITKENILESIDKCEVAFAIYKEKNLINQSGYNISSNKEQLLTICGYLDGYSIEDYLDEVFIALSNNQLVYNPDIKSCENCINSKYCPAIIKDIDDNNYYEE